MVKQRKGSKEELIMPMKNLELKTNTPTPEQMRIAQILEKKVVDSTIKLKLKQIMDATQRSADEVYVALHDSDFDVNRAVNLLIEREDQLADWCTNEKRKKKLAELKEKKEAVVEAEVPPPENKNPFRGRGDNKRTSGRRQDGGRQTQGKMGGDKPQDESRKQSAGSELRAPRGKRPGFGSMVFERSNPPPTDSGILPPVRNQWEKPLLKNGLASGLEDDWDCEEFQGSLSQTRIFTSSKRHEPQEISEDLKTSKVLSPSPVPTLSSLTLTNKTHDPRDQGFVSPVTPQMRDAPVDVRPRAVPSQDRPIVASSQERPSVILTEDRPSVIPSQDKTNIIPSQDRSGMTLPAETRTDYAYRLNYAKHSNHEDKRPTSKIPTLPVEMPPELKPSLSFLDIQFGAVDLCPSEISCESQSNQSSTPSQNPSVTTLMSPSSMPSSCSVSHLMANNNISLSSTSSLTSTVTNASSNASPLVSTSCSNSPNVCSTISSPPGMITSPPGICSITNPPGLNNIPSSIVNPGISSINTSMNTAVNQSLSSVTNTALNSIVISSNSIADPNMSTSNSIPSVNLVSSSSISSSISHLMGQSSVQQAGANMPPSNSMPNTTHMGPNTINHAYGSANNQNRFMPPSQAFNGSHLQYGIINPPGSSLGYESRDTPPPPHLPQPHTHLPPFKSPPGVPKGAMMPNLPPGPLVGNQYIVGQGNVPYFSHPPIYYYEEVPPVMNSQQRLTSMTSHPHHYDVSYQTAPSNRDSVHYNV